MRDRQAGREKKGKTALETARGREISRLLQCSRRVGRREQARSIQLPTRGRKKHQANGTAITARRDHSASRAAGAYPDTPATPGSVLRGDGGDEGGRGVAAISTSTASSAAGTTGSVFHSPSPTW